MSLQRGATHEWRWLNVYEKLRKISAHMLLGISFRLHYVILIFSSFQKCRVILDLLNLMADNFVDKFFHKKNYFTYKSR